MAADGRRTSWGVAVGLGLLALLVGVWLQLSHGSGRDAAVPPQTDAAPREMDRAAAAPRTQRTAAPADGADAATPAPDFPATHPVIARKLSVLVVAKDGGALIEGADVRVVERDESGAIFVAQASTGADGTAVLELRGERTVEICARKPGFQTARVRDNDWGTGVRVELVAGIALHGRVLDFDTGAPVQGARVQVWPSSNLQQDGLDIARTTDELGRFEFAGLAPGEEVRVYAAKSGYGFASAVATPSEQAPVLDIFFGRGGIVEGTVYDAGGAAMAGVETFLLPPVGTMSVPPPPDADADGTGASVRGVLYPPVRTDAAGHFAFRGIALLQNGYPNARIVVARDAQGRTARSEPVTFAQHGERATRDVRFAASSTVAVRVASASPPPEGFEIEVQLVAEGNAEGPDEYKSATLKDGASNAFDELPPGRYVFRAQAGSLETNATIVHVTVPIEGGSKRDLTIDFSGDLRIEGAVVDGAGRPCAGAKLMFSASPSDDVGVNGYATADADGKFAFTRLPRCAGEVVVTEYAVPTADDVLVTNVPIDNVMPGGPPLRIVLAAPAKVTGHLVPRPADAPVTYVGVVAEDAWIATAADAGDEGAFTCRVSVVGKPVVPYVACEGFAPVVLDERTFAPGATVDLGEIALGAGLAFDVTLQDADGRPLANANVRLADPWLQRDARTGADGRVRLERLPRRPVHVHVDETPATAAARITFDPAARTGTFTLGKGVRVTGRVLRAKGGPLAGQLMSFIPAAAGHQETAGIVAAPTDADGRFDARLVPGRWRVATVFGPSLDRTEFDVADGENAPVELRVK